MSVVNLIKVKVTQKEQQKLFRFFDVVFPNEFERAKRKGLQSVALFLKRKAKEYIKSGGDGSWAVRSKIAASYTSSDKVPKKITFRKKESLRSLAADQGLSFLMRYFDWDVKKNERNEDELFIHFRESSTPEVNYLITQVQEGDRIKITDKMRRAYSFTDFPLRNEKSRIVIPPRDMNPVFLKNKVRLLPLFKDKYLRIIEELVKINE